MPRRSVRQHLIDQAERLDGTQRLIVDTNGARVVDQAVELFDHQDFNTHLTKVIADSQANGASPYHNDIGLVVDGLRVSGSFVGCCCHVWSPPS
ncbi:hypothetical protein D3C87_1789570 [compost metagenome]